MKNDFNIGDLVRQTFESGSYGIIIEERCRAHGASSFRIHWTAKRTSWESRLWLCLVARAK